MTDSAPPALEQPGPAADLPAKFRIAPQGDDDRVVIDLMPLHPYRRCPAPVAGEITVCAEAPDKYRYNRALDEAASGGEGEASISLGEGVKLQAEVESVNIGGFTSNRVMMRIKINR